MGGQFLDAFHKPGYTTYGIDIARSNDNSKRHPIIGEFTDHIFDFQPDLITLEGHSEHVCDQSPFLDKAINMANKETIISITSTPNSTCLL